VGVSERSLPGGSPEVSLVLACYNEGPGLAGSVAAIVSVLDATRFSYELIFVDDGSRDPTPELIGEIAEKYRGWVEVQAILHPVNVGRGGAVRNGMRVARGEIIGFVDVDLEIGARYIVPGVLAIRRGADVAVARRVFRLDFRSVPRHIMSRGYAWLVRRLLRLRGPSDTEAGFKFFRRGSLMPLLAQATETGWFWDTEMMALADVAGLEVVDLPCLYVRQFERASSVRPLHDSLEYLVKLWRFRRRLRALRRAAAG
jgi:dolichyl-phosphate beta-glucosyltransferase